MYPMLTPNLSNELNEFQCIKDSPVLNLDSDTTTVSRKGFGDGRFRNLSSVSVAFPSKRTLSFRWYTFIGHQLNLLRLEGR